MITHIVPITFDVNANLALPAFFSGVPTVVHRYLPIHDNIPVGRGVDVVRHGFQHGSCDADWMSIGEEIAQSVCGGLSDDSVTIVMFSEGRVNNIVLTSFLTKCASLGVDIIVSTLFKKG